MGCFHNGDKYDCKSFPSDCSLILLTLSEIEEEEGRASLWLGRRGVAELGMELGAELLAGVTPENAGWILRLGKDLTIVADGVQSIGRSLVARAAAEDRGEGSSRPRSKRRITPDSQGEGTEEGLEDGEFEEAEGDDGMDLDG